VPHHLLLEQLARRGITGLALRWVESFLTDRTQVVRTEALSTPAPVTSGVIQGSAIGPAFYSIFVDSLLVLLDIPAQGFADDLKIVANRVKYSASHVQENIDRVRQWSEIMGMPLSLGKLFVLYYGQNNPRHKYHCGNSTFQVADTFTDLGVLRSSEGNYHEHVINLANKGRRLMGLCRKTMQSRDPVFMIRLYTTYIRPVLMYAAPIWSPYLRHEVEDLESVQKSFTKLITGEAKRSYGQRLFDTGLLSLESERLKLDLITIYKIIHQRIGISMSEAGLTLRASNTRGGGWRLQHPIAVTSAVGASFKFRAPRQWESLPVDIIRSPTLTQFRVKVHEWLRTADQAFFD
jgi:hypothetical protein